MHGFAAINTLATAPPRATLERLRKKSLKCIHRLWRAGRGTGPSMVMPLNVLEKSINKRVQLLLKDNRILEGKLVGYDDYMNMVLEDTEETKEDNVRRVGTVVLRGNNVVTIVPK